MLSLLKIHPEVRETRKNWSNLTLSWRRSLSYWNQSIHLLCKPMDCFYMILTSAMKELKLVEYIRELLESLHCWNLRNSRPEVFCKEAVLRSFTKFTGKHLYQSLFFDKVAGPGLIFSWFLSFFKIFFSFFWNFVFVGVYSKLCQDLW